MTPLTGSKGLRRLALLRRKLFAEWLTPALRRRIWRVLTFASLVLVGSGVVYMWRELPPGALRISPAYVVLASAIYVVTYAMHTLGWHTLAGYFFGSRSLAADAEAIAASNLVKYLPTIAWYIANRTEFYREREVPARLVVAASLGELALMIGAGTLLYLLIELLPYSLLLSALVLAGAAALIGSTVRRRGLVHLWLRRRFGLEGVERPAGGRRWYWLRALLWYGGTWPLGVAFLWAIVRAFGPAGAADYWILFHVWLVAGLASYAVSLGLGSLGIAREITLTVLLAQHWPLPVAVATAILVKTLLTLGEIGCSGVVLGWRYLQRRRAAHG